MEDQELFIWEALVILQYYASIKTFIKDQVIKTVTKNLGLKKVSGYDLIISNV